VSELLPPDLPRLRVIETYLAVMLRLVREAIAAAETREQERERGAEHRPPVPDWVLETGIGSGHGAVYVHIGGCHMAGKRVRAVGRDVALRAIAEGVEACSHCRPDTELGVLD
jgi:hypothetical protein